MRPLQVQYVKANNPSRGHLGIIGQIYNTNQGKAISLVDRAKNFQYMYDVMFDRLNLVISKNSLIKSSRRSALSKAIERYFVCNSFDICVSSRNKVR